MTYPSSNIQTERKSVYSHSGTWPGPRLEELSPPELIECRCAFAPWLESIQVGSTSNLKGYVSILTFTVMNRINS